MSTAFDNFEKYVRETLGSMNDRVVAIDDACAGA
jgi:hypothetical protein